MSVEIEFSAAGPPFVSPLLYTSYGEQHNDEVMKIFDIIQTMEMDVPILMGDFNHGPSIPGLNVKHYYCMMVVLVIIIIIINMLYNVVEIKVVTHTDDTKVLTTLMVCWPMKPTATSTT